MNDMASDDILPSPEPEPKLLSPDLIDELADDTPVTPEKKERISKSVIRTSNRKVQVQSRYLSPSSGSCHDYCKYGHKNLTQNMTSFIAKQIKKKMVVNSKPLFKPNGETTLNQVPRKKIERLSKPSLSPAKSMIKRSTSLSTKDAKSGRKCNDDVILKKGVGIIQVNPMGDHLSKGKKKEMVTNHVPLSPKQSIKKVSSGKSQNIKDPKEASRLKRLSSVPKAEKNKILNKEKIQGAGQTPYFDSKKGKQKLPDAVTVRPSLVSGRKSLGPNGDQKDSPKTTKGHDETKTQKQTPKKKVELDCGSKRVGKKTSLEEKNDLAYKLGFKRGKVVDVKTKNTAPRRLKFKPRNIVSEDLNSKADDVAGLKSAPAKQMTNHKMGSNGRLKRVGKVGIEGKNEKSAYKLDFERGKVIDVQPKNTVPRRLKFKPRKVVAENLRSDNSRRNLKKVVGADEVNGLNAEHLRVVLKHQNVEGNKRVESLLNNVIEETATRLVRLRKSKVKALVGAFESLMSLPDARSSTPSAS